MAWPVVSATRRWRHTYMCGDINRYLPVRLPKSGRTTARPKFLEERPLGGRNVRELALHCMPYHS